MSPSSDIETLFGHFGGNAGDYQEIGRENEASSARTRWPLLVTLDLTQPAIPAIPKRRDPLAKPADEAAQAPADDAQAANAPAEAARPAPPQVRSKTPLFARPHRRTIPPVGQAVKTEAPRGAERFAAMPQAANTELGANEAEVAAAPLAITPSALAPQAPVPPVAASAIPLIGNVPPGFAPAMAPVAPVAVPPVVARATSAAPAFRAPAQSAQGFATPATPGFAARAAVPVSAYAQPASTAFTAPAAPTVQPPSILGKLFKPAAPSTAPTNRTPAAEAAPAALGLLFDRLRGDAPTPATPAPHSWLTNGPRRS
jgi:hypothetical protein